MKAIGIPALFIAATIAPAFAQTTPPMTVPLANKHLAGVVESVDRVNGELRVVIQDNDGYDDDVTVASDARTRPAGAELAVGDRVLLTGYNAGSYFDATAISIEGPREPAAPEAPAPADTAPAPPQNTLPSYAAPAYPAYTYVPYPVYVPAPVYYGYPPSIGVGFYGGVRGPGYFVRGGYRPVYRPYGYRR